CMACHGQDGKVPVLPNYPRLAGQNSDYMAQQLRDFKTQKRTNNLAPLMFGMTNPLSEADIKAISDYLAAVN
ncbi:MAG: c-type cytochrome, partial [Deltaproteobacteria bacterium]|nr:c-type cytochrome [Deltaproteobacteria bacterium]